jgi:hypothetical protein
MRWHPPNPEPTFLRFVRKLADYMGVEPREVCLPMAWYFWRDRRMDAFKAFLWLAR